MSENSKIPPSLRQNFSVPGYVNVTYTCEKGYRLQDPNSNVIGCKYVTTPRKFSNGTIHNTVVAEAVWKSADGMICEVGKNTIKSNLHCVSSVYFEKTGGPDLRKQMAFYKRLVKTVYFRQDVAKAP